MASATLGGIGGESPAIAWIPAKRLCYDFHPFRSDSNARTKADPRLTPSRAFITAIVAIVLWIMTKISEFITGLMTRRRIKSSVLRSLFAEVDYNTRDLEVFLRNSPDIDELKLKLEDKNLTPYITDARHTSIYHANISHLHHMEDNFIQNLVAFHGGLADIRSQIDGVLMPSYKTISVEGQVAAIERLIDTCKECEQRGQCIIANMKTAYPKLSLSRNDARQDP